MSTGHWMGGILFSTHWLIFDPKKALYGESMNWKDYDWFTEDEYMEIHAGEWWHRDV